MFSLSLSLLRGILVQVVSKACEAQHGGVVFMDLRVALGDLAIGPSTQRRLEICAAGDLRCSCGIFLGLDVHHQLYPFFAVEQIPGQRSRSQPADLAQPYGLGRGREASLE